MPLLEVRHLRKEFGGLVAVNDLSFEVRSGEIVGLIGPNGAGKTTTFNLISGMLQYSKGEVHFDNRNITGLKLHEIAKLGLVRTFQLPTLFSEFPVLENVLFGCHLVAKPTIWGGLFNSAATVRREAEARIKALEILDQVGLKKQMHDLSENLPHGHSRILQLAISLATQPKMMLLDEPVTGMNLQEVEEMLKLIKKLRDSRGITFVIVEHNVKAVMRLCERIVMMNFGAKLMEGTPEEVTHDKSVIEAYLGKGHGAT